MYWKTSKRTFSCENALVMGILNVTPDSFSDGGSLASVEAAVKRAGEMSREGADIIDVGGESTRPGSVRVSEAEEIARVVPVIEAIVKVVGLPVSIDTSKATVAKEAIGAGAEIINDISGLRWEPEIGNVAAETGAGLVLMHSRGEFESMHSQEPVEDIFSDVEQDLHRAIKSAIGLGIRPEQIALDIGIGFGKTPVQNLELIANLDRLVGEFAAFPILIGASRKSFIGKTLGDVPANERLGGSLACAVLAVWNGAQIVRVHDVRETIQAIRVVEAIKEEQ